MGLDRIINPSGKEGADLVIDVTGVSQFILNSFEITGKEVVIFGFTNNFRI